MLISLGCKACASGAHVFSFIYLEGVCGRFCDLCLNRSSRTLDAWRGRRFSSWGGIYLPAHATHISSVFLQNRLHAIYVSSVFLQNRLHAIYVSSANLEIDSRFFGKSVCVFLFLCACVFVFVCLCVCVFVCAFTSLFCCSIAFLMYVYIRICVFACLRVSVSVGVRVRAFAVCESACLRMCVIV